jgi:hypothetical protein
MLSLRTGCLLASGIAVILASCGGAIIALAVYGHAQEAAKRDRALEPVKVMMSQYETRVLELSHPNPGLRRYAELREEWNEFGGLTPTSPTSREELAAMRVILEGLRESHQEWQREGMRQPARFWIAAGEVGLTCEFRYQVVERSMHGSVAAIPVYEARWAQLDAMQEAMQVLAEASWTHEGGEIRFADAAMQRRYAEALDDFDRSVDELERSIESLRAQRGARPSPESGD